MKDNEIKKMVRKRYAKVTKQENTCCGPERQVCCDPRLADDISRRIGYSQEEMGSVPQGANLGLGCGNPVAIASLREGETVLDLGSGAGFDCFLAAQKVGKKGRVIGLDMTPEMVEKARENAKKGNLENVEFKLGDIENLPIDDSSVDVVISNCVINLTPDKGKVFKEAFRVLKPGGRMMISDLVLLKELPEVIKNSPEAYVSCVSGAMLKDEYLKRIKAAGFDEVRIDSEEPFASELIANDPMAAAVSEALGLPPEEVKEVMKSVISIRVSGIKCA